MEATPFMKWIAEQQKQGNLPDTELVTMGMGTVVRGGEILTQEDTRLVGGLKMESKMSDYEKLTDLESVVTTRTPVYGGRNGDIRIKLDTDVNGQEWYVVQDDSIGGASYVLRQISCWMFPHFNGSHDYYRCVPVDFCFKTFAEMLAAHPEYVKYAEWQYEEDEYARRLKDIKRRAEYEAELAIDAAPPRTIEVTEREYREILARRAEREKQEKVLEDVPF